MMIRILVGLVVVAGGCKKDGASAQVASTADVAAVVEDREPPPLEAGTLAAESSEADAAAEREMIRLANMLTAGDGSPSEEAGSRRRPGADLLAGEPGTMIGESMEQKRGPESDLGAQVVSSRENTAGGEGPIRPPAGRIKILSRLAFDEGITLTVDTVVSKLQSTYLAGLLSCYADQLAGSPAAAGKLDLMFTVAPTGGVFEIRVASTLDPTHAACAQGLMRGWRFPVPKDADGDPTEAGFQLLLQHTPT